MVWKQFMQITLIPQLGLNVSWSIPLKLAGNLQNCPSFQVSTRSKWPVSPVASFPEIARFAMILSSMVA